MSATPDTSPEAIRQALEPFAHFWRQWQRQPMRGLDDEFYCIHTGSEFEASLRRSDCERAAALADALDQQAAAPTRDRLETAMNEYAMACMSYARNASEVNEARCDFTRADLLALFPNCPELAPTDD